VYADIFSFIVDLEGLVVRELERQVIERFQSLGTIANITAELDWYAQRAAASMDMLDLTA